LALAAGAPAGTAQAAYVDDVGFALLQAELGAATPDGTGLTVTQVEACNGDPCAWAPNPGSRSITAGDGGPAVSEPFSGHANGVGSKFYGDASTTPAIGILPSPSIAAYEAGDWLLGGFLRAGQSARPNVTPSRIANHSYIAFFGSDAANLEVLRRLDWLVATDEYIQVVGFTGGSSPILSSALNIIAVNNTGAPTNNGSRAVAGDAAYAVERTRPDLVAPAANTSSATPRVASAVALLMAAAQADPALSNGSTTNRDGATILNAERSEVVKAVLMAGADRATSNTHPATDPANITGYRINGADQTANGLDRRYGAGQLNIHNSYHIIAAGEQDSVEDAGAGVIGSFGFDYDPAFGGSNSSNTEGTYFFATAAGPVEFIASLVWNIDIDPGPRSRFDRTATLHNLDLLLYDVSDAQNWVLLQQSASTIDNTENLRSLLAGNTSYALRVQPAAGQNAFRWDYGLAWRSRVVNLPSVIIDTPANGTSFLDSETITLSGTATDVEDGDLGLSIVWSSSLDGSAGTGATVNASLSAGNHTLTATVTDSDGFAPLSPPSVQINVLADADGDGLADAWEALFGVSDPAADPDGDTLTNLEEFQSGSNPVDAAPVATILTPADGFGAVQGAPIEFSASATDTEDGNLAAGVQWFSDLDGPLGTGATLSVVLSNGQHQISVMVTDSQGAAPVNQTSITVSVAMPGDINGDGSVTVSDLLLMEQAATGNISLTQPQMSRADLYPTNGDGILDVADLLALQKIVRAP